jgi:hypothetical protein
MRLGVLFVAAIAATTPACTLGAIGVTSSAIGIHNEIADSSSHWNYTTPLLISAAVGFAVDIASLLLLAHQWDKPMT